MIMQIKNYQTSDIYTCAYLLAQGIALRGCERQPDGRLVFHFDKTADIDGLLRRYWSNEPIPIVPAQLFSALRHLKSLLHARHP
jgi:hypothetical protein